MADFEYPWSLSNNPQRYPIAKLNDAIGKLVDNENSFISHIEKNAKIVFKGIGLML